VEGGKRGRRGVRAGSEGEWVRGKGFKTKRNIPRPSRKRGETR
jgi:hypothetical protein